mgnify:CR=1 FL=1
MLPERTARARGAAMLYDEIERMAQFKGQENATRNECGTEDAIGHHVRMQWEEDNDRRFDGLLLRDSVYHTRRSRPNIGQLNLRADTMSGRMPKLSDHRKADRRDGSSFASL